MKDKILHLVDVDICYYNKKIITSISPHPSEDQISLHEESIHLVDDKTPSVNSCLSDNILSHPPAELSAEHNNPSDGDTLPPHDSGNILQAATTEELSSAQNDATATI